MSATSVQFVPFHSSVLAEGTVGGGADGYGTPPPKAIAEVLDAPAPPAPTLAVFKTFTSVQLVPFHSSVLFVTEGVVPPKANAEV